MVVGSQQMENKVGQGIAKQQERRNSWERWSTQIAIKCMRSGTFTGQDTTLEQWTSQFSLLSRSLIYFSITFLHLTNLLLVCGLCKWQNQGEETWAPHQAFSIWFTDSLLMTLSHFSGCTFVWIFWEVSIFLVEMTLWKSLWLWIWA